MQRNFNFKKDYKGIIVGLAVITAIIVWIVMATSSESDVNKLAEPKTTISSISEDIKEIAINGINNYLEVKDSAITQEGTTISLVVIVNYQTSKEGAKEIGESFVRMVKTFSEDVNPDTVIGDGIYDYLITVAYSSEEILVQGAKARISTKIRW